MSIEHSKEKQKRHSQMTTFFSSFLLICMQLLMMSCATVTEDLENCAMTDLPGNGKQIKIGDNFELDMAHVIAGTYEIEKEAKNKGIVSKDAPYTVKLTQNYWIGKCEVTEEQYEILMGTNPSELKRGAKYPVELVSWNDAQTFCKKLNRLFASQLPDGYEFRLPTEAEWEYAAQIGKKNDKKEYITGVDDDLQEKECYGEFRIPSEEKDANENQQVTLHQTDSKSPNELGLYHMNDNVLEWCLDSCDWDSINKKVVTRPFRYHAVDPLCKNGSYHLIRGDREEEVLYFTNGSEQNYETYRKYIVYRECGKSSYRFGNVGFRIALAPCR